MNFLEMVDWLYSGDPKERKKQLDDSESELYAEKREILNNIADTNVFIRWFSTLRYMRRLEYIDRILWNMNSWQLAATSAVIAEEQAERLRTSLGCTERFREELMEKIKYD